MQKKKSLNITPEILKGIDMINNSIDFGSITEEIKKNETLNPLIFDKNGEMLPKVNGIITKVVDRFLNDLEENDILIDLEDVILCGSNASYNYTDASDLDIHLLTNKIECEHDLFPKVYDAYRRLFNNKYDVKVGPHEIEIYVDSVNSDLKSNGIYSLSQGWLKVPNPDDIPDDIQVPEEYAGWEEEFINVLEDPDATLEDVDGVIDAIYDLRKEAMQSEGEYGKGNLIFKEIRNKGLLQDIRDKKQELENKSFYEDKSLKESLIKENATDEFFNSLNKRMLDIYNNQEELKPKYQELEQLLISKNINPKVLSGIIRHSESEQDIDALLHNFISEDSVINGSNLSIFSSGISKSLYEYLLTKINNIKISNTAACGKGELLMALRTEGAGMPDDKQGDVKFKTGKVEIKAVGKAKDGKGSLTNAAYGNTGISTACYNVLADIYTAVTNNGKTTSAGNLGQFKPDELNIADLSKIEDKLSNRTLRTLNEVKITSLKNVSWKDLFIELAKYVMKDYSKTFKYLMVLNYTSDNYICFTESNIEEVFERVEGLMIKSSGSTDSMKFKFTIR